MGCPSLEMYSAPATKCPKLERAGERALAATFVEGGCVCCLGTSVSQPSLKVGLPTLGVVVRTFRERTRKFLKGRERRACGDEMKAMSNEMDRL